MAQMCIASTRWRDADPHSASSLSSVLVASGYRLKFSAISPDFIFNNSGSSVAFIVVLYLEQLETPGAWERLWDRVAKMASSFQRSYMMTTVTINEDDRFIDACFSNREKWRKSCLFMPVRDWSAALQNMITMSNVHTASKIQDSISTQVKEKMEFVSSSETVVHVICSIPGLELHDAHSLLYGIGSLKLICQASAESLERHTDLSHEKALRVVEFFRNDNYNRTPHLG